ncbi:arylamine N-acetyltransferase [Asanoa sp. WMMD1127]|uniref:arylamine N-acetyltransferase family protein n=1 Tax=Asanoa sp. WMMD1127 TaxID=3016107 RepID=UPI002416F8A9|nr:arylamine N-acetyltransferase [Asanoa sp. WMMD1127]MDG4824636.1 arylamine N-acetyltransferase [Asanoa sp. WMMD1127]
MDLEAYLERVGLDRSAPTLPFLRALHEAHVRTFTFDNIDVLLDQHPGVELPALEAKFVGRGRGGYCFEHATLFAAVLEALGYQVERRLGRVGDVRTAPRTHCVVIVSAEGARWLADPGFGHSLLRPILLADGAQDDYRGWPFRLAAVDTPDTGRAWRLERFRGGTWEAMHTVDELPVHQVDVRVGHHFTSTYPSSHFRSGLMLTRHRPDRHISITHETVTVRRPGEPTEHRTLEPGELEKLLADVEAGLTADETTRLLARVDGILSAR